MALSSESRLAFFGDLAPSRRNSGSFSSGISNSVYGFLVLSHIRKKVSRSTVTEEGAEREYRDGRSSFRCFSGILEEELPGTDTGEESAVGQGRRA